MINLFERVGVILKPTPVLATAPQAVHNLVKVDVADHGDEGQSRCSSSSLFGLNFVKGFLVDQRFWHFLCVETVSDELADTEVSKEVH